LIVEKKTNQKDSAAAIRDGNSNPLDILRIFIRSTAGTGGVASTNSLDSVKPEFDSNADDDDPEE
jgi:hypothetical protein